MTIRRARPAYDDQFRAFVQAERGDLLRTAIFLTAGDTWAAEDLVQTALTRVYAAWPRLREHSVRAYTRRCLLNALIDHRRSAFVRRERPGADPAERAAVELAAVEPATLDRQSAVFRALSRLPPRMRATVVMRHLLDLTVEEAADALSCRAGTVRSQTARGLAQLREALVADDITIADQIATDQAAPAAGTRTERRRAAAKRHVTDLSSNPYPEV